jgi:flagellar hook-length control protein FliK
MEGRPPTELKSKKSTLPDTLGLIHPHVSQTDSIPNIIPFEAKPNTLMLEGGVVAGAMSRNRISTESIGGIAQSIRQLSAGGEMRIRLKPDHLGELHVKVVTSGRGGAEVGLQIQASDERAKKILEESVGSLKEGLAAHHLSLSKLDVQIVPPSSQTTSFGDPSQDRQSQQGQPHLSSGFGQSSDRGSRQESTNSAETTHARGSASATQRQQFSRSTGGGAIRPMAASRLDVIA